MTARGPVIPSEPGFLRVLARQVKWRTHWALHPGEPYVMRSWWDDMTLVVPRSGSVATDVYRTFGYRPIAYWISDFLRPGMTFVDVGANVGIYSYLAARVMRSTGAVHAIEPQPGCIPVMTANAARNGLVNLTAHQLALAESDGETGLVVNPRNMGAATTSKLDSRAITVPALTLDSFAARHDLETLDLMKLDAGGKEAAVLRGASTLLEGNRIGRIICKLYTPRMNIYRSEEAGGPHETVEVLESAGYTVVLPDGRAPTEQVLESVFSGGAYTVGCLAVQ